MAYADNDQANMMQLYERLNVQDEHFPQGYPYDRNNLRAAIAAIEDETEELKDEWKRYKRVIGIKDDHEMHHHIRHELLDIAGIVMLALRNVPDDQS